DCLGLVEHGLKLPFRAAPSAFELVDSRTLGRELAGDVQELPEQRQGAVVSRFCLELDHPALGKGLVAGSGVIAKPQLVADAMVQPRGHAVVQHAQQHFGCGLQRAAPPGRAVAERQRSLAAFMLEEAEARLALWLRRSALGERPWLESPEPLADAVEYQWRVDRPGDHHGQVLAGVVACMMGGE